MSTPNSILFRPAIDRLVAIPMGSTQTSRTGRSKLASPNAWRVSGEPPSEAQGRVRCTRGLDVTLLGSELIPLLVRQSVWVNADVVWHGIGAESDCWYVTHAHQDGLQDPVHSIHDAAVT